MKKFYFYFKAIFTVKTFTVSMAFLFTSCYSEYLTIDYDVHWGAAWNDNHTKVAFVASKMAYRSAEGIAAFPDGGKPKYLLKDVGLYTYDCENKLFDKLITFSELTGLIGSSRIRWSVTLALTDTMVCYLISPVPYWDWWIETARTPEAQQFIKSLREKYGQPRAFNVYTKTDTAIDTTTFNNLLIESEKCDLTSINRQLAEIPLADWDLILDEIYPKSDREYIEETIYLINSSSKTRRAVVEQIIAKKRKSKIESILKEMDDYKNSLEEPWKSIYEQKSRDTYEQIKTLL